MSQIFKRSAGIVPPGTAIVTLTGDVGGAVPPDGAGNIDVLTGEGLTTTGIPGSNLITWSIDTYTVLTTTTTNNVQDDSMTIALDATPAVFNFDISLAAFNTTDILGAGYTIAAACRTDGVVATLIEAVDYTFSEEGAMTGVDVTVDVDSNNLVIYVTGLSGKTINWRTVATYNKVT